MTPRGWLAASALVPVLLLTVVSCSTHTPSLPALSSADSTLIVEENLVHRAEVDSFFRHDDGSPFHRDTTVRYHGIHWYPIDPHYRAFSTLHHYDNPETVIVMGTKGEERRQLRYGYFSFVLPDENGKPVDVKLNVYKFTPYDGQRYLLYRDNLSVWFTDRTTGTETYDVGRYVEIGNEDADADHLYRIDLNMAFNPYCAYSPLYSCAVPRKEDHIDLAVRAGEMKYHD